MRAEVALLSGMILRVYKDRVVGTCRHARFAANADRLIKINDTVGALEHRRSRARSHARCVSALITASDLVRSPHLWECANINVFDISASH